MGHFEGAVWSVLYFGFCVINNWLEKKAMRATISTDDDDDDVSLSQAPFPRQLPVSFLTYLHLSCSNIIGLRTYQGQSFLTGPIINFLIPISHMCSGSKSVTRERENEGDLLHH